jgi:hypothetical protein
MSQEYTVNIATKSLENVSKFKYLGMGEAHQNCNHKDIKKY